MRINYDKIERLGGYVNNAEFVIMKCNRCGTIAIYDEENCFLYMNPKDMTQKQSYGLNMGEPIVCPSCGSENTFEEVDNETENVMDSEWAFLME